MSSLFSLASAESTSASSVPECEPSPSVSVNPPRSIGSASIGRQSRSSTMSAPSQASLFADLWTSSPEDSHVNPSASPGSRKAQKTSGTSGLISHDSSEKSDPVGYWLRTYLASELSQLTSSSKTWRNSGTPHGRLWWVLTTLERPTGGSASGSWPTPHGMQCDNERMAGPTGNELGRAVTKALWPTATAGDARMTGAAGYSTESERNSGTTLTDAASGLWASPQARRKDSGPTQGNRKSPNLGTQAHAWPTPKAADGRSKGTGGSPDHGLDAMARAGLLDQESRSTHGKRPDWPTPTAHDGRRPGADLHSTQGGNLSRDVAREWATPTAHDSTPGDASRVGRFGTKHGGRNLNDEAVATEWPTPRANRHGAPDSHGKSPIRGALSPAWVTQLMGYPDGWLDTPPPIAAKPSKPSATPSSLKSSRSSGAPSSNAKEGE